MEVNGLKSTAARAFTLVELLVVIGIIAVLIGLLMPMLSKARAAANLTVCRSNIRQLGHAVLMYCQDNGGCFPTCAYWDDAVSYIQSPDDWIYWQANRNLNDSRIAKYVGKDNTLKSILRCPSDDYITHPVAKGILPGQGPYFYSYAMSDVKAINGKPYPGPLRTKVVQWRANSLKILLTEALEKYASCGAWNCGTALTQRHGTGIARRQAFYSPGDRMGINASACFLDGHVEGINDDFSCQQFQNLKDAE